MGTTTTNMGLSKPTLQNDPGTWDDQNNATIDRVDIHNHTTGLGVQVPSAGIGINADLTMAGYSLTNLRAACFTVQTSFSTNRSLWVRTSDNALIWRDAAGTDWKLADSAGINVSLVGGIKGDYAAASAALYYDDTAQAYRFLEATPLPNSWSYVKAGGVDIYEHGSGISNFVRIASPAGLPASYTWTLPAALPGSTAIAQVSSTGVVTTSNTVTNSVTFSAGATAAAGQNFTVSTTGDYKHGDRVRTVLGLALTGDSTWTDSGDGIGRGSSSNTPGYWSPDFNTGDQISSVTVSLIGNGVSDALITVNTISSAGVISSPIGQVLATNPGATYADTVVACTPTTLATGEMLRVTVTPNASGIIAGNCRITWSRP